MSRLGTKDIILHDHRLRSIMKTITWRVIATGTTAGLVYIFTGELEMAMGVGALEVALKLAFYYFHERGWGAIAWGQVEHPLSGLPVTQSLRPEDRRIIERQLEELGYL